MKNKIEIEKLNLQEEPISFPTAILAREKGYPQTPTKLHNDYYNHKGELNGDMTEYIYAFCDKKEKREKKDLSHLEAIAAPSQALLQKFLRSFFTPIIVTPKTDLNTWEVEVYHPDKGLKLIKKNKQGRWFNSYEEALEAGLYEGLKLLNLKKQHD